VTGLVMVVGHVASARRFIIWGRRKPVVNLEQPY
jgi:hypothetical protein